MSDPEHHPLALPIRDHGLATERHLDSITVALSYHQRTKHHQDRYARSLGYLDWASQPDPFRTYEGAERVELPLAAAGLTTTYADLFSPGAVPAQTLDRKSIAILFELALGLSAWKEFRGNRWALRCNPSSGNLHPTEGYAIVPSLQGIKAGVYHYVSRDHCLEQRCLLNEDGAGDLARALPAGAFLVGLSSIHWREAWKYGERAFRYCQHDAGHAIATVRYAAASLGWSAHLLDFLGDDEISVLLGLDRTEDFAGISPHDREHPDALILVSREPVVAPPRVLPVATVRAGHWAGRPNQLSPAHFDWDIIGAVAQAAWKPATGSPECTQFPDLPLLSSDCRIPAATLIRQRRSCQALDGQTALAAQDFFRILDHLLPRPGVPPWDALSWPPHLHVAVFVHRVSGLAQGLYMLERHHAIHDRLRACLRPTFLWRKPSACPDHLPLYCLVEGDLRRTAQIVSCHQEIAADGAFSLGMIADFAPTIRRQGAWWYRRLFWEAGVLGQALYLEAEATGMRSTGIGCYFDDTFHELLGLDGDEFQDLYHFTVGGPVEDQRLLTLPPYPQSATSDR